jgi:hypothetical protein
VILTLAFLAGCSTSTTAEPPRLPTSTPTGVPASTPTATSIPSSTPTAISTLTESERGYLLKFKQSIANIYRNSDEVWTLVGAGTKNGLPDWASIADLVDSISTSARPMCNLSALDTYSSLRHKLQVICSKAEELKSMVDDKLKSKPIQLVQLIPSLQAVWEGSKDLLVASSTIP